MVTPAAHREAAAYLQATHEMSQRRACRVLNTDRASGATRPRGRTTDPYVNA